MAPGPYPPSFTPGYASPPQPPNPEYPPTSQFPPTPTTQMPQAYSAPHSAQPDYTQPGYVPPQYSPPGYGAPGPAGKPPRKSSLPIVAVLVAVTLLLCGGVVTAGVLIARNVADRAEEAIGPLSDLPSAAPEIPALPTDLPDLPTALPSLPAAPDLGDLGGRKIKVTYEVTGNGKASQILYVAKVGEGAKRLQNVDLPWKLTVEMETPAAASVVAMRVGTSDVSISCRAVVDGTEVKQSKVSSGPVAVATCNHLALN